MNFDKFMELMYRRCIFPRANEPNETPLQPNTALVIYGLRRSQAGLSGISRSGQ